MNFPDLRPCFPNARVLRELDGDVMLCDPDFEPGCGFVSIREAEILWRIAKAFPGEWVEIGSHVGWSAAHLTDAGAKVTPVDPAHTKDGGPSELLRRAQANWDRSVRSDRFYPRVVPVTAERFFARMQPDITFDGVFIDGCHNDPEPLNDANGALATLEDPGVIVLHDYRGQPVKDAVKWLRGQGLKVKVWDTMNGIAACWRGDVELDF